MAIKLALFIVLAAGLVALTDTRSYGAGESNTPKIGGNAPSKMELVGGSVESMHGGAYRGSGGPSTRFVKEHGGYDPGALPITVVRARRDNTVDISFISTTAGRAPHSCPLLSPQRNGGISEMASCGNRGVRGNRSQFVRAITRSVASRPFLSQLAH